MRLQRHEDAEPSPIVQHAKVQEQQEASLIPAARARRRPSSQVWRVLLVGVALVGLIEIACSTLLGTSVIGLARGGDLRRAYSTGNLASIAASASVRLGNFPAALEALRKLPVGSTEQRELRLTLFQAALRREDYTTALSALELSPAEEETALSVLPLNEPWGSFLIKGGLRQQLAESLLNRRGLEGAIQLTREHKNPLLEDAVLALAAESNRAQVATIAATLPPERWERVGPALGLAYVRQKTIPEAVELLQEAQKTEGISPEKLIPALPESQNRSNLLEAWAVHRATQGEFAQALALTATMGPAVRHTTLRQLANLPKTSVDEKKQILQILRKEATKNREAAVLHDVVVQGLFIRASEKEMRRQWLGQLLNPALRRALEHQLQ